MPFGLFRSVDPIEHAAALEILAHCHRVTFGVDKAIEEAQRVAEDWTSAV